MPLILTSLWGGVDSSHSAADESRCDGVVTAAGAERRHRSFVIPDRQSQSFRRGSGCIATGLTMDGNFEPPFSIPFSTCEALRGIRRNSGWSAACLVATEVSFRISVRKLRVAALLDYIAIFMILDE